MTNFRRDAANGANSDDADATGQRAVGARADEFRALAALELSLPVLPRLPPAAASSAAAARLLCGAQQLRLGAEQLGRRKYLHRGRDGDPS